MHWTLPWAGSDKTHNVNEKLLGTGSSQTTYLNITEFKMIISTFFAIALGLYFGVPLLKVLLLSALLQSAIAVGVTRSSAAILTTTGVVIAAGGEFFLVPFFTARID